MKKTKLVLVLMILVIAMFIGALIYFNKSIFIKPQSVLGQSSTDIVSSEAEWEVGTLVNVDSNSEPGKIQITDKSHSTIDLAGIYNADPGSVTVSHLESEKGKLLDGFNGIGHMWGPFPPDDAMSYWQMDLGQSYDMIRVNSNGNCSAMYATFWTSNSIMTCNETVCSGDGQGIIGEIIGDMSGIPDDPVADWSSLEFPIVSARYILFHQMEDGCLSEVSLWGPGIAVHTSAATQITDTNFYRWQTFSPTYTEPANTDISFKFRTSTDSTNWTAWSASQTVASGGSLDITELVTSSTGDPGSETFYKYIQVETTFTNSDGISTPTLSDYTIGYHTNVVPDAPTPGSVTIGS